MDSDTEFERNWKIGLKNEFFVTIDVFLNIYIICGNVRSFIGVVDNKHALAS